jgi:glutaminyl-tRNA synthetase
MAENTKGNFIHQIIEDEIKQGKNNGEVYTRFPPEPNGYLHIGHAKAICLSFTTAQKYNGKCNLRFDDTNPSKEEQEYVDSIKEDVKWLGFQWEKETYTSDFFEDLYQFAIKLIKKGLAYVDDQSADEIASQKGTPTQAGTASPFRERSVEENLELFEKMRNGEFEEGACVLRAKIDMANSNMHMRDPLMYRIINKSHHRTGDKWHIYPMYDFAHGQTDFFEGITHSLCTLEFEVHRPLYEWYVEHLKDADYAPRQIEFARLNLTNTVMSKRKLLELVQKNYVNGWDDPRMPTVSALRRRGYTPLSIRRFAEEVGIAKRNGVTDLALLEHFLRDELNKTAERRMAVLNPLKVVITNYEEGKSELLDAVNNPEDESAGSRQISFSRELYIEREDFMENAPRKFFRLSEGREVRLRYAFFVTCNEVIKDENGEITELRCTYDPLSKGGKSPDGRKVKGTLHWVDANNNLDAEVRVYDRLFTVENPDSAEGDYKDNLNPDSLKILQNCKLEKALVDAKLEDRFQFERKGYYCLDKDSTDEKVIFNQAVTLKDGFKAKK